MPVVEKETGTVNPTCCRARLEIGRNDRQKTARELIK
jgi:hypothetical protein